MRRLALVLTLLLIPTASAAAEQVHLGIRDADALAGYAVSWVATAPTDPTGLTFHGADGDTAIEGTLVPGPTAGRVYEARLPPLGPGANASYSIGERTFALRVPPADAPLRIIVLGDMGVTRAAGDAVKTIAAEAPALVLHVGDVSYAGGDPVTWKAWFDLVEPVASTIPWLPALGNHEGDVQGLSLDQASVVDPAEQAFFTQRFPLPAETFWYSFDVEGVHFIALDTFSGVVMPPAEAEWLAADLAAAKDADWIVAYFHEPPYSSNANHGSSPRAHDAFAAMLEEAGVDLVITGHDHHYERTHTLRGGEVVGRANETTKGNGTVYIVTGGGGASLYTEFNDPQPEWSAVREAVHHVLALEITRERIEARAIATDGSGIVDSFSIARAMGSGSPPPSAPVPGFAPWTLWVTLAILAISRARRVSVRVSRK